MTEKITAIYKRANPYIDKDKDKEEQSLGVSALAIKLGISPKDCIVYQDSAVCYERRRISLSSLIKAVKAGEVNRVLVYDLSRLAESPHQLLQYVDLFRKHGAEFVSARQPVIGLKEMSQLRDDLISEKVQTTIKLKQIKANLKSQKRLNKK